MIKSNKEKILAMPRPSMKLIDLVSNLCPRNDRQGGINSLTTKMQTTKFSSAYYQKMLSLEN